MIKISFYPKFLDESIDRDAMIATYREWLEQHGEYGRLFMWDIGRAKITDENSTILGVRIFEEEVGTLFKLLHDV